MLKNISKFGFKKSILLCVVFLMLFGQIFKLHLHLDHVHHHDSNSSIVEQIINFHPSSLNHDVNDEHHNADTFHHGAEIEISVDTYVSKVDLLKSFLYVFVSFIGLFLLLKSVVVLRTNRADFLIKETKQLFTPPLRAPPQKN